MRFHGARIGFFVGSLFFFGGNALANEPVESTDQDAVVARKEIVVDSAAEPSSKALAAEPAAAMAAAADPASEVPVRDENLGGAWRAQPTLGDVTNNGAFSYRYPIDVPAFRGLEPKLAFTYNSSRKTKTGGEYQGWLGYGWGLSGIPVIERAGYALGVTHYLPDDVYLLNGEPLAQCKGAGVVAGASCLVQRLADGSDSPDSWVSEVENYLRIKFDSTNNVWEVTARDGTKTTLTSVGNIAGAPATVPGDENNDVRLKYRWLATSVIDTLGNEVSYSYNCADLPVCYPTTISYNDRAIRFYYETRPDYISVANGHTLSNITKRIKTILVQTSGLTTWGYKLSYDQAPLSDASRLVSAQQFGSNLEMDDAETITAGTTLPKTSFDYNDATGFSNVKSIEGLNGKPYYEKKITWTDDDPYENNEQTEWRTVWANAISAIDVNSDGITEVLRNTYTSDRDSSCSYTLFHSPERNTEYVAKSLSGVPCIAALLSRSDREKSAPTVSNFTAGHFGTDRESTQILMLGVTESEPEIRTEVKLTKNGDDFAVEVNDCTAVATASNAVTDASVKGQCDKDYPNVQPSDADGNGRDTLWSVKSGRGNFFGDGRDQKLSNDGDDLELIYYHKGIEQPPMKVADGVSCGRDCVYLDLNGDGLDDVIQVISRQGGTDITAFIFTGDRLVRWRDDITFDASNLTLSFVSDRDGDGKAEFGIGQANGNTAEYNDSMMRNRTWDLLFLKHSSVGRTYGVEELPFSTSFATAGDFNGDGQTDLLVAPKTTIFKSSYVERDPDTREDRFDSNQYAEDFFASFRDRNFQIRFGSASGGIANLLNTVRTAQGGQVKAGYTPSTAYANTYLPYSTPTVSSLSTLDGRGQTATTRYAYAGGFYNIDKRRFLGFSTVTKALPKISGDTNAPVVKTTYKQSLATIGLPSKVEYLDDDGLVRRTVSETYAINTATLPYSAENTATTTAITVGAVTQTLKTTRLFDAYGNITEERNEGRTDEAGDEILSQSYFKPNTGAYIVSLPWLTRTYKVDPAGNRLLSATGFLYDGQAYGIAPIDGKVTGRRDYKSSSAYQLATFDHDGYGNVTSSTKVLSQTDPTKNETTTYAYDATHRLFVTSTTYPSGLTEKATPNAACSAPATKTGVNGVVTSYSYDVFCRQTLVENETTGSYTKTAYQSFGDPDAQRIVTSVSRPNYSATADQYQYFDGMGRIRRVLTAGDTSSPTSYVDTEYDLRGNASRVSLPYEADAAIYWTTTAFDWANRPIRITNPTANPDDPNNSYKSLVYGLQDAVSVSDNIPLEYTRVADEEGDYSYTYTSAAGDVIGKYQKSATAADGAFVGRWLYGATFDGAHRMIGAKDHSGAVWTYTYDSMGNRLTADDPDLGIWTYAYDDANRLIQQTDARKNVTTITYNKDGQPLKTTAFESLADATANARGTVLADNTYNEGRTGYYNKGLLTTAKNGGATQAFDYNADGLLQKKEVTIGAVKHVEETGYDKGRLPIWKAYGPDTEALDIGTSTGKWIYNRKSQLISIPGYITAIEYEPDGQTSSITYANGVVTKFTYSPQRRWLVSFATQKDPGNDEPLVTIVNGTYTRDTTGRILSINASGTSNDWIYEYDGFGRVVKTTHAGNPDSSFSEDFTYYANDNLRTRSRLTGSFSYPAANLDRPHAPLSLAGVAFTYDANGNLESDGARDFTYDLANRVATVVNAAKAKVTLSYGPDGARAKKTSTYGTTLYPDANAEYDTATQNFTRYPHMDIKVVGKAKFFLHRDHLSSVRAVTDINGAVIESSRYLTFGDSTNKAMDTQKNYIGERFDPETGLMYLNARYMDPKFGRFISPDDWNPCGGAGQNCSKH